MTALRVERCSLGPRLWPRPPNHFHYMTVPFLGGTDQMARRQPRAPQPHRPHKPLHGGFCPGAHSGLVLTKSGFPTTRAGPLGAARLLGPSGRSEGGTDRGILSPNFTSLSAHALKARRAQSLSEGQGVGMGDAGTSGLEASDSSVARGQAAPLGRKAGFTPGL